MFQDYTQFLNIFKEIDELPTISAKTYRQILAKYPPSKGNFYSKEELIKAYRFLLEKAPEKLPKDPNFITKITLKPTRTISGVATVTVLTKPFPCPGECIFCPNDIRMPKSYLSDEPGAQRAEKNHFDPYLQTYRRLKALYNIGHSTEKVEIIILGGTWSFYPEKYQIWFIKRIFEALNDFGEIDQTEEVEKKVGQYQLIPDKYDKNYLSFTHKNEFVENAEKITQKTGSIYNLAVTKIIKENSHKVDPADESSTWEELEKEQEINTSAKSRCVGLVIETRPDKISPKEVIRIRRLGCTKTQIGFQSLSDEVLEKNHRGHDVAATRYAVKLLRQAGFKIHAHWMANLYGATPETDIEDYQKMFSDSDFKPDELKVYPCSLIETAELVDYYNAGKWKPYDHEELLEVVSTAIYETPEYCRLTRIIRDIPSPDIVVGNKFTNFREMAEKELERKKLIKKDIRSREIKNQQVTRDEIELKVITYQVQTGTEKFLQFVTKDNKICGFLRLSLPNYDEIGNQNSLNSDPLAMGNTDSQITNSPLLAKGWTAVVSESNQPVETTTNKDKTKIPLSQRGGTEGDGVFSGTSSVNKANLNDNPTETNRNFQEELEFLAKTKPAKIQFQHPFLPELSNSAIIREVHVYGQTVSLGDKNEGKAQHLGLGTELLKAAEKIANQIGYPKIAVISAIGTREYYQKRGFELEGLYQTKEI
jgi:elongator complex protein 3